MALVTVSSGGIGKAVAIALAKEGADVVLASRNVPNVEKVKKEVEAPAEKFSKLPIFLTPEQCAAGLLEGMQREDYLIVVPDSMVEMVRAQGRDIVKLNAGAANPPPRMPPPER